MTKNRELSKLGSYITVNSSTDTIDFGDTLVTGDSIGSTGTGISSTSSINTTGIITASSFYGDGSNLTNLIGVGAGVEIRDNGTPVGTASTLDFLSGVNFTFSSGIGTIAGTSSVGIRGTVSGSTGTIGIGSTANITITGYKTYALLKAEVSAPSWVTLYCDTSSRTSDSSRLITEDPAAGSGVIAEVITTTTPQTVLFTPTTIGFNNDVTPSSNIYAKVVNNSGVSTSITISLTVVQLES